MNTIIKTIINVWWQLFISLKLTFILLVLITIGSILGMSFDQTKSFDDYIKSMPHSFSADIINSLELFDAFHSWWFALTIVLLALNLIACSLEKLPKIYYDVLRPRPYLTKRRQLGLKHIKHMTVSSRQEALALIHNFFPKGVKLKPLTILPDYYYASRYTLARFGVYIVHTALLIIMFSSIYATQYGVNGHVMINEGDKTKEIIVKGQSGIEYPYDLGFYIGCSDFRLQTFVNNAPMEYESDLYIDRDDKKIITKTVRVNDPLTYAGFTFYQSSYQPFLTHPVIHVQIKEGEAIRVNKVKLDEPIALVNNATIAVAKFYDDFAGLGEAIMLEETNASGHKNTFHVFRRYPEYDEIVRAGDFSVIFLGSDGLFATGLSVGYVPGISIILGGFFLLLIGLYLCFFLCPMRFFACINPTSSGFLVSLAVQGFRQQDIVASIFHKQLLELRS